MLGKLVKYDFKATARIMLPVFVVMLSLSAIFALMIRLRVENGFIFSLLTTALFTTMAGSGIATVVCIANRFNQGLLKNEGYLSFALPVKTSTHIGAKLLNGVIWSILETVAVGTSIFVIILITSSSQEIVELFRELLELFNLVDMDVIVALLKGLSIMACELISSICMIYAGFAVAHLFDKHKSLVIAGFVIIIMTLNSSISTTLIDANYEIFASLWFWYVQALVPAFLYLLITWFILDRRLNLE
jgi:hypothetical protein